MFFCIDKPVGVSSFGALKIIRKQLQIKKIGHTGTLDPLASGVLIIATGSSTKLLSLLEKQHKTYRCTTRFDAWSETGDSEGPIHLLDPKVVQNIGPTLTKKMIQDIANKHFLGHISQIPPKYSALRIDGKRAYQRARAGEDVHMPTRSVEILSLTITDLSFPEVTFEASVSAGTYIRTLAQDIGKKCGLDGYVTSLRRTRVGHIGLEHAYAPDIVTPSHALSLSHLFPDIPTIIATEDAVQKLQHGMHIACNEQNGRYFVLDNDRCICLAEVRDSLLFPKKVL